MTRWRGKVYPQAQGKIPDWPACKHAGAATQYTGRVVIRDCAKGDGFATLPACLICPDRERPPP